MAAMKNRILRLLSRLPLGGLFRARYSGMGSILFMHKVVDSTQNRPRIALMAANELESAYLDSMIGYLKGKGYEFITLDEMTARLQAPKKSDRQFIALTFDDGYRDNLTLAAPICEKHQVPATVYVTNCYPNHSAQLWWYMLEDILLEQSEVIIENGSNQQRYPTQTQAQKDTAFAQIRRVLIDASPQVLDGYLSALEKRYDKQLADYVKRQTLSWEDVKELARHPYMHIGGHSMNHLAFNTLTEDQIKTEVLDSKKQLESHIQEPVNHFAYPFGTRQEIGQREIAQVGQCDGIHTAVTTRMGNIFGQHRDALHALPRIQLLGSQQDVRILELYLSGLLPAIKNRFKKVVTL